MSDQPLNTEVRPTDLEGSSDPHSIDGVPGGDELTESDGPFPISTLLLHSNGRIGEVARLAAEGITDPKEIVERGAASSLSAVSSYQATIRAISGTEIPDKPTPARNAAVSTRSFLRQHKGRIQEADKIRLQALVDTLEEVAGNRVAQESEDADLRSDSEGLENALREQGGVYVYTYPHYWRFKTVDESQRTFLKVGMTTKDPEFRVKQQTRQTSMPEDPLLLRVYRHESRDPKNLERVFHRLLDAAEHTRSNAASAGREWFETSVEFLDTIASVLELATVGLD